MNRMGGVARLVVAMDGGRLGGYSVLVFTGWDHGLQDQRATKVKHNNLRYRLQVGATSATLASIYGFKYTLTFFVKYLNMVFSIVSFFRVFKIVLIFPNTVERFLRVFRKLTKDF